MAKMMGPRFKQCRRLGLNVCGHPKAMNRATKGTARNDKKLSDYGTQLLEKQRLRAYYGVMEKQFANYFEKASKSRELTGHALINLLECRLDNLVYRLGFANSIRQARQMVVHGHFLVNGKKVDIPSYIVKPGQKIEIREKSKNNPQIKRAIELTNQTGMVDWVNVDKDKVFGIFTRIPAREEIVIPVEERLIVELYSK